jgi:hypothetical protein
MNGRLIEGIMRMKFKSIATLLALSFVVSTGVPAFATKAAHPANRSRSFQHNDAACRETIFRTCIERESGAQRGSLPKAPQDDWSANMILDNFQTHAEPAAGKMVPTCAA